MKTSPRRAASPHIRSLLFIATVLLAVASCSGSDATSPVRLEITPAAVGVGDAFVARYVGARLDHRVTSHQGYIERQDGTEWHKLWQLGPTRVGDPNAPLDPNLASPDPPIDVESSLSSAVLVIPFVATEPFTCTRPSSAPAATGSA